MYMEIPEGTFLNDIQNCYKYSSAA